LINADDAKHCANAESAPFSRKAPLDYHLPLFVIITNGKARRRFVMTLETATGRLKEGSRNLRSNADLAIGQIGDLQKREGHGERLASG
jgi:hypothetical protein